LRFAAALVVVLVVAGAARADAKPATCPTAAARVVAKGVWLGVSGGARCFAPDKDGKVDEPVLGPGLVALAAARGASCDHAIEIAGDNDVAYQRLIATMDLAIKAGLADVALVDPAGLSVKIDDSDALEKAARRCAPPPKPAPAPGPAPAPAPAPAPSSAAGDAPVIAISRSAVSVDGTQVVDVKALAGGKGAVAAIVEALRKHAGGDKHAVVIQADRAVAAGVIDRVTYSARQAGYDNVLFAVKNK
jgi:biopolymer transport protein ExbD